MTFHLAHSMRKHILSSILILYYFIGWSQASMYDKDIVDVPQTQRLVNDFAGMLSPQEVESLENKLVQYDDTTSTQIAIVTVPTIGNYPVEEYGIRLSRKWGIGDKEKDNGILILIAQQERKVDIETGYKVGQYISDIDANRIIRNIITPNFKNGQYYQGLNQATDRMIQLLSGGFKADSSTPSTHNWGLVIIILIIIILIIIFSNRNNNNGQHTYTGSGYKDYFPPIWGGGFGGGSFGGGFGGGSSSGGFGGGFGGFGGGGFGGGGASGGW